MSKKTTKSANSIDLSSFEIRTVNHEMVSHIDKKHKANPREMRQVMPEMDGETVVKSADDTANKMYKDFSANWSKNEQTRANGMKWSPPMVAGGRLDLPVISFDPAAPNDYSKMRVVQGLRRWSVLRQCALAGPENFSTIGEVQAYFIPENIVTSDLVYDYDSDKENHCLRVKFGRYCELRKRGLNSFNAAKGAGWKTRVPAVDLVFEHLYGKRGSEYKDALTAFFNSDPTDPKHNPEGPILKPSQIAGKDGALAPFIRTKDKAPNPDMGFERIEKAIAGNKPSAQPSDEERKQRSAARKGIDDLWANDGLAEIEQVIVQWKLDPAFRTDCLKALETSQERRKAQRKAKAD